MACHHTRTSSAFVNSSNRRYYSHPMKKFVLAPVLAALAMFVWGFIYWGAPHHLPYKGLGTVADESATALAVG